MRSRVLLARFLCLFALAQYQQTMVTQYWSDTWLPEFHGRLSAPRSQELQDLQCFVADLQPTAIGDRQMSMGWPMLLSYGRLWSAWYRTPFGSALNFGSMSDHLEEKDPSHGEDFWVAPSPEPSPDMTHAQ